MGRRVIISDTISPHLAVFDEQIMGVVEKIFQYFESVSETEMKTGARWTDRTGVARSGLVSTSDRSGNEFTLHFASMASYGIWLEIRWSGKYAIVGPVMSQIGPRLAEMIADTALP
jgi:hypothetical protein